MELVDVINKIKRDTHENGKEGFDKMWDEIDKIGEEGKKSDLEIAEIKERKVNRIFNKIIQEKEYEYIEVFKEIDKICKREGLILNITERDRVVE